MEWEKLLNEQQLKGVYQTEGAVLVIAGAGSGKTRVLTYRIAYLLQVMHVAPTRILAITFTNKATKEMKERIESLCENSQGLWISTFHAMCARILRRHIDLLGYTKDFTIYDDVESMRLIKKIIKNKQLDEKMYLNKCIWHISNAKNKGLSPDKYVLTVGDPNANIICEVYERYEEEMKLNNALDYDDLLLKTVILFMQFPDVLRQYQERFLYIHIDEYQDTNKIQYALVKMLAELHGNIFAVGDEDQSIYGWRGADINNILSFRKDFADATVIKLEQNYRSTENILAASNALIKNNRNRFGKTLWSDKGKGDAVVVEHRATDGEEAEYVVSQIGSMLRSGEYEAKDFAVLVRLNALTSKFEERFNSYNIPYKVFGGFRFFERKEIKDVLAYCRLLVNPRDSEALLRAINTPKRGIGDKVVQDLVIYAAERSMAPGEVLFDGLEFAEELSQTTRKKLMVFRDLYADIFNYHLEHGVGDTVRYIAERAGFAMAYAGDDEENYNKRLNIDELIQSAEEYERENEGGSLSEYLQSVTLSSDSDEILEDNYVTVATVHAVKGLEFPVVFVVGLEENIFPSGAYSKTDVEIEEERRVMYVAMTRAQKKLYMTYCDSRFRFGHYEYNRESRFLTEIKEAMGWEKPRPKQKQWNTQGQREWGARATAASTQSGTLDGNLNQVYRGGTTPAATARQQGAFRVGDRVAHPKFGKGMIIGVDGDTATIAFESVGVKKLSLKIAPLSKL